MSYQVTGPELSLTGNKNLFYSLNATKKKRRLTERRHGYAWLWLEQAAANTNSCKGVIILLRKVLLRFQALPLQSFVTALLVIQTQQGPTMIEIRRPEQ